jgi:hypothetical protein
MPFRRSLAHHDRRVLQAEGPKAFALGMAERLSQDDRSIAEHRKRRQELVEEVDPAAASLRE